MLYVAQSNEKCFSLNAEQNNLIAGAEFNVMSLRVHKQDLLLPSAIIAAGVLAVRIRLINIVNMFLYF